MYRQQQQFQAHHGAMDPVAARQKEEQRRKQQAYAQALAQQVQQQELQKQRDKSIERQGTSHGRPQDPSGSGGGGGGDKGLFDGFGEKGNQNRTNFARGQRYPPATAASSQYDQHPHQVSPTRYGNAPEPRDPFEHLQHNPQGFQQQNHHFGGNGFNNPDFGFPGHGNPQLFTQPQQIQNLPPAPMGATTGFNDWGAPLNPQQLGFLNGQVGHQQPQHFQHHQQQHEDRFTQHFDQQQQQQLQYHQSFNHQEPQGQRGLRSDPSSGGFGGPGGPIGRLGIGGDDDSKARRKLQQQQEIQNALQKQVEEKNRQKLEAKKRQEDEDRREVERFEAEKRRLKQEEDKIKEEKRRKAEEELVRAQQAAIALSDHQKKAQQQQHLQNQQHLLQQQHLEEQASPPRALRSHQKPNQPQYQQQQQQRTQTHKSPQKLDPFSNTRAHLFEDPPAAAVPSPQRRVVMAKHTAVHEEEDEAEHSPMRHHPVHRQPNSVPNFPHPNAHEAPRDSHLAPHNGLPPPPFVELTVLLRQYDEMKAELMHQRQLVDQLRQAHVQIQIQQQQHLSLSPSPPPNASVPTLSDLEQLRNELREELEHRERLHRQELEKFRRQQEQLRSINMQQQSSPQGSRYHHLRQDDGDEEEGLSLPVNRQQNSPFKAQTSHFVSSDSNQQHSPPSSYSENNGSGLTSPRRGSPMQSSIDTRIQRILVNMSQERELGSTSSQADLNPSSSLDKQQQQYYTMKASSALASLQCDSKMVYFDGRVRSEHQHPDAPSPPSRKRLEPTTTVPELVTNLEDSMDQLVSEISVAQRSVVVDSKQQPSTSKSKNLDRELGNNQDDSGGNRTAQPNPSISYANEDDDDALAFFVKDFRDTTSPKPSQPQTDPGRRTGGDRGRASGRYSSWTDDDGDIDDLSSPPGILSRLMSRNKWLRDLEINEESDDDADDDGELHTGASLTGEELEAIFQRNVRRHEILLGFQPAKPSRSVTSSTKSNQSESRSNVPEVRSMAWTQLHQQLEENAAATSFNSSSSGNYPGGPKTSTDRHHGANKRLLQPEDSLIASSRWMPSAR